jgi:hypothetical protein
MTWLAEARDANERPAHASTGSPQNSASLTVVCPPKGIVSRNRSASAKRLR